MTLAWKQLGTRCGKRTKHTSGFQSTTQNHTDGYVQDSNDKTETSGMGCMLCHGSLVMSFKAKSFTVQGCLVEGQNCGSACCDADDPRKICSEI